MSCDRLWKMVMREANLSISIEHKHRFEITTQTLRAVNRKACDTLSEVKAKYFTNHQYNVIGEHLKFFAARIVDTVKRRDAMIVEIRSPRNIQPTLTVGLICNECGDDIDPPLSHHAEILKLDDEHLSEIELLLSLAEEACAIIEARHPVGSALPNSFLSATSRLSRAALLEERHLLRIAPKGRIDIKTIRDETGLCIKCGRAVQKWLYSDDSQEGEQR